MRDKLCTTAKRDTPEPHRVDGVGIAGEQRQDPKGELSECPRNSPASFRMLVIGIICLGFMIYVVYYNVNKKIVNMRASYISWKVNYFRLLQKEFAAADKKLQGKIDAEEDYQKKGIYQEFRTELMELNMATVGCWSSDYGVTEKSPEIINNTSEK